MQQHSLVEHRYLCMLNIALNNILQYIQDEHVIEIMVNTDGKIWLDSLIQGKKETDKSLSIDERMNIIKLIANYHQTPVSYNFPELACELPFYPGRFQAWIHPVTSTPTFTIRKKSKQIYTLNDYVCKNWLSKNQAHLIQLAIEKKLNIIIAGNTGSGKTTLANAILHEISKYNERVIVLEDVTELQVSSLDTVSLRTTAHISMQQLVKSCLRMRPDRIIIGEVRDGTALDLLKAWNTGHSGSLCTIHANNAKSVLSRLENLILEAVSQIPPHLIKEAVDIIIFMQKNGYCNYHIEQVEIVSDKAKQLLE